MTEKIISQDSAGIIVNGLTVLREFMGPNGLNRTRHWEYRCVCGNISSTRADYIKKGHTKSCGCLVARLNTRHGMSNTTEYHIWENIIQRTTHPSASSYERYGGNPENPITVCDRWRDFQNFYADMGPRPSLRHTVERKDGKGNYEPANCSWETFAVQSRNRSDNRNITFNGRTQCLTDWASEIGLNYRTLDYRIKRGWPLDKAMTLPAQPRGSRITRTFTE